jgi:hypothetical protein
VDAPGFARVVTLEEIRAKDGNLSVPLYVAPAVADAKTTCQFEQSGLPAAVGGWLQSSAHVRAALDGLLKTPVDSRSK